MDKDTRDRNRRNEADRRRALEQALDRTPEEPVCLVNCLMFLMKVGVQASRR